MGCKKSCGCKPKTYYQLDVPAGTYSSDNLFRLFFEVIRHRTWHLLKHGRWID